MWYCRGMCRIGVYALAAVAVLVLLLSMACKIQSIELSHIQLKANFGADPTYGEGPLTVQFSDKSTGEIESWAWDFDGDGQVDSGDQNPTFVYTTSGSYDVSLTVTAKAKRIQPRRRTTLI